jgi:hypothetical protein
MKYSNKLPVVCLLEPRICCITIGPSLVTQSGTATSRLRHRKQFIELVPRYIASSSQTLFCLSTSSQHNSSEQKVDPIHIPISDIVCDPRSTLVSQRETLQVRNFDGTDNVVYMSMPLKFSPSVLTQLSFRGGVGDCWFQYQYLVARFMDLDSYCEWP